MRRVALSLVLSLPLLIALGGIAHADDCSAPSDCQGTVWVVSGVAALAAALVGAVVAAGEAGPKQEEEKATCVCRVSVATSARGELSIGLASPSGTLTLPRGKSLPIRVVAQRVDVRTITGSFRDTSREARRPPSSRRMRIKVPARLEYEWEIKGVELWNPATTMRVGGDWDQWPEARERGEFKAGFCSSRGWRDTGETVLYQPPALYKVGERAQVRMKVTARDELDQAEGSLDIYLLVALHPDRDTLSITVTEAKPAPPAIDLAPETEESACPCRLELRWEDPESGNVRVEGPSEARVGEAVKLSARATPLRKKLAIWCEGAGCENDVVDESLPNSFRYAWTATAGSFPAGSDAASIVYQAPPRRGDARITVVATPLSMPARPPLRGETSLAILTAPIDVYVDAFIPMRRIENPQRQIPPPRAIGTGLPPPKLSSDDVIWEFEGDGRGFSRWGQARAWTHVVVDLFTDRPLVEKQHDTGTSRGYDRSGKLLKEGKALPDPGMMEDVRVSGFIERTIKIDCAVGNPLLAVSDRPHIDYHLTVILQLREDRVRYVIGGHHDGFPSYAVYIGRQLMYGHDCAALGQSPWSLAGSGEFTVDLSGHLPLEACLYKPRA